MELIILDNISTVLKTILKTFTKTFSSNNNLSLKLVESNQKNKQHKRNIIHLMTFVIY